MIFHKHIKRKAISPILAEVALIAITLVSATALSGFVFGLFTGYTSSATVTATVQTCSVSASTCTVTLTNTGTANAYVVGCSIHDAGVGIVGVVSPAGTPKITAGHLGVQVTCTLNGPIVSTSGARVLGFFSLTDGYAVPFTGVWSP